MTLFRLISADGKGRRIYFDRYGFFTSDKTLAVSFESQSDAEEMINILKIKNCALKLNVERFKVDTND